jgi:hypothetical protein
MKLLTIFLRACSNDTIHHAHAYHQIESFPLRNSLVTNRFTVDMKQRVGWALLVCSHEIEYNAEPNLVLQ